MLTRIAVIAQNTYREAVRARLLYGLFALALATAGYCLVVGKFALQNSLRVISDLGAATVSLYGVVVAIVLGATSLHSELELKTIFPILARPIHRSEYLVGKYLGTLLTLAVFIGLNAGVLLMSLALLSDGPVLAIVLVSVGATLLGIRVAYKVPRSRVWIPAAGALLLFASSWFLAAGAPDDRRVIAGSALLSLLEVAVVTAVATLFSSFSSPFLTAILTFGVFIVGRSADTMAHLPVRMFGEGLKAGFAALARVWPNLMVYVPPRPLLTGEASGMTLSRYLLLALAQALAWSAGLLAAASSVFRRRDFL
jgi:ABC-type transport system involved in multi-copper enzyme maturation permease subunit